MSPIKSKQTTKTKHTLNTPYPPVAWPLVPEHEQNIILEHLCSLLAPIGEHRSKFVASSCGKRSRRKRTTGKVRSLGDASEVIRPQELSIPPLPGIASFLTIGFNSTERALESASRSSVSASVSERVTGNPSPGLTKAIIAVFVDRSSIPSVLYAHLPQLIATASLAFPSDPTIRLIALPHGAGKRMSIVLQISRVGIVGLLGGAPHAAPLIELIREHVPPVEVPWLDNLRQGNYLPVGINSTKTVAFNKPEMSSNDRKDSRLETLKQQSELAGT